jgi:hypothetical protein
LAAASELAAAPELSTASATSAAPSRSWIDKVGRRGLNGAVDARNYQGPIFVNGVGADSHLFVQRREAEHFDGDVPNAGG